VRLHVKKGFGFGIHTKISYILLRAKEEGKTDYYYDLLLVYKQS
jgi:hypothetical protein